MKDVRLDQEVYGEDSQDSPIQLAPATTQLLMILPFETMRQHLESVIIHEFETALGIYSKQAEELDNAFMKHADKFEETVRAELEKICITWQ